METKLMINHIVVLIFITILSIRSVGQLLPIGHDIQILERELFPDDTTTIFLYEYLGPEAQKFKLDSTIRIRLQQPDHVKVLNILKRIMYNKDVSHYNHIYEIYSRHIEFFWFEWSDIYIDNPHPPKIVMDQYAIITGFEHLLKSLDFTLKNLSLNEIFNEFYQHKLFVDSLLLHISKRCEMLRTYEDKHHLYRSLNPCRLYGGIAFNRFDPFIDSMRPYFIETMLKCKFDVGPPLSDECRFFIDRFTFYERFNDERIVDFLIKNFELMSIYHSHSRAFFYERHYNHYNLSRFLIEKWIGDPDNLTQRPYLSQLLTNDFHVGVLIEEMNKLAEVDVDKALSLVRYMPMNHIKRYAANNSLNPDELLNFSR